MDSTKNNGTKKIDDVVRGGISAWMSTISASIPVFAVITLGASIVWDKGYVDALGLSFSEIPTTLSDHARTAVLWIPTVIFAVIFGAILLTRNTILELEKASSLDEPAPQAQRRRTWFDGAWGSYLLSAVALAIFILLGDRSFGFLVFAMLFLLMEFLLRFIPDGGFNSQRIHLIRTVLLLIVMVPGSLYLGGYHAAMSALRNRDQALATIEIGNTESIGTEVRVIRSLERVTIVVDKSHRIWTISTDSIGPTHLALPIAPSNPGYICNTWNMFCPKDGVD